MVIDIYYIPIPSIAIFELKTVLISLFVFEVVPSTVTDVRYEFPIMVDVDTYCKSCMFYCPAVFGLGVHVPGFVDKVRYVMVAESQAVH
jgi:hypothetical protein